MVSVAYRGRLNRGRIRSAAWLGDRHRRPLRLAAAKPREETRLLLGGPGRPDRRPAEPRAGHREVDSRVAPRKLFDRNDELKVPLAGRTIILCRLLLADEADVGPLCRLPHDVGEVPRYRLFLLFGLLGSRPPDSVGHASNLR